MPTASGGVTDSLGLSASSNLVFTTGGATGVRTVRTSLLANRVNWGSVIDASVQGPNFNIDDITWYPAGPVTLGVSAATLTGCRNTGVRIYKHPLDAGTIQVGLWNSAGVLQASTSVTWSADTGGWRTVSWTTPVTLISDATYHWGYTHASNDQHYAYAPWVWNGQDTVVYPVQVQAMRETSSGRTLGAWKHAGVGLNPPATTGDRSPANYFIDPLLEWDLDSPGYVSGTSYYSQFSHGGSRFNFPVAVFFSDPEYLVAYKAIGVNTLVAGDATPEYIAAVKTADMDWYPSIHGGDMNAPIAVAEDSTLAAKVRGYLITDEPDLNTPFNSPTVLRSWRNACRQIDSTRPMMLNLSRFAIINQGYTWQPVGINAVDANTEWREFMSLADIGSADMYSLSATDSFYFDSNANRYGIWTYPMIIKRMRTELTDGRIPIWGVVETTSAYANSPTTAQVQRAVWASLIAGATGIIYFDHRFPSPQVTQDFAAGLHTTAMATALTSLHTQLQTLGPALLAAETGLIESATATGTLAAAQGGYPTGAQVPMHYTSRAASGTQYLFVQSIRAGSAGTVTLTAPSLANTTLTVIGESRTVSVNSSGVFTDTFTGDYAYHLYSTTATPAFSTPANTVAPVITTDGTPQTGETVTVSTGTWTGVPTPTYSYQWQRNSVSIAGAVTSSYTLQASDESQTVRCVVTATNSQGSTSANSGTITPAAPPASGYSSAVTADTPVAYWRLASLADTAGSHTLTLGAGTITDVASLTTDTANGAKHWDGTGTSYLTTPDASDLRVGSGISVETWIKIGASADFVVISKAGDWRISQTSGNKLRFSIYGASSWFANVDSTTTYSVGSIYHVVGTWDTTTKSLKIYVNGTLDNTVDASSFGYSATTSGWGAITLGYDAAVGNTGFAAGDLDEVAVYTGALSGTRIAAHYTAGH